jgi:hypothetical protein
MEDVNVTAEYTCKTILERDHSAVENAVGGWDVIPSDDRIPGIAPDHISGSLRSFFPGNFHFISHRLEISKKNGLA